MTRETPASSGVGARWTALAGASAVACLLAGCGGHSAETTPAASDGPAENSTGAVSTQHASAHHASGAHPETGTRSSGGVPEKELMHDTNAPQRPHRGDDSPAEGVTSAGLPGIDPDIRLSPTPVAAEAIALARSTDPADHDRLVALLLDPTALDRLDSPELAQVAGPERLQLGLVLREAAARAPSVLDRLVASPLYAEPGHRQITLIDASEDAREPGAPLVAFWRSQLDPDADELESTIVTLVRNQSGPALGLLADAFTSDAFDDGLIFWWFRGPVLEHRQDARILAMAARLVEPGRLSGRRRAVLIESLFEYRPQDWYVATEAPPHPPARATLDDRARGLLRSIADSAVRLGMIDGPRRAEIEAELTPGTP